MTTPPTIPQPEDGTETVVSTESAQEEALGKLSRVPVSELKGIMARQLELEVQLKHKELQMAEDEIGKCEAQMIALRKFLEVLPDADLENEPSGFTTKYYNLLSKSFAVKYSNVGLQEALPLRPASVTGAPDVAVPEPTYRTRSTTSSLRPSAAYRYHTIGCLYRRTDGVIVKLTCPDCRRSNFLSAQGFLNHSRIAHSKEYTSQDAASLKCGEVLPDSEQDEEGLASLQGLRGKGLDPNVNLNVNEVFFPDLPPRIPSVEKSVSPLEKSNPPQAVEAPSQLMKKLIDSGVTKDLAEFDSLVANAREHVGRAHLFADEEDDDDDHDRKRRKSRSSSTGPPLKIKLRMKVSEDKERDESAKDGREKKSERDAKIEKDSPKEEK